MSVNMQPSAPATGSPYDIAARQIGMNEVDQRAALSEFMATGGVNLDPSVTAWCAGFVNASLGQSGVSGTGKLNARSFLDWGESVDVPQRGDIAVFSRGDPNGWQGHVGFFDGLDENGDIRVLGGNQGDGVNVSSYAANRLMGYRRAPASGGVSTGNPVSGGGGQDALYGQAANDTIQAPKITPEQSETIYSAYIDGQMTPQQRADYESDIASGLITAPTGNPVPQVTPEQSKTLYDAFIGGQMNPQQSADYIADVGSNGLMSPASAEQLQAFVSAQQNMTPLGFDMPNVAAPVPQDGAGLDIARDLSSDSFKMAGMAAKGAVGLGPSVGASMLPENMNPTAKQVIGQVLDAPIAGLSTLSGVYTGAVGAVADGAEALGVPRARTLGRDLAAIPDAFAGSPNMIGGGKSPVARVRGMSAAEAAKPALDDAQRTGIRVLTSDIRPPETFAARTAQAIGEKVPFIGTGPIRANQAGERASAVRNVVREFIGEDAPIDVILRNITDDALRVRQEMITTQSGLKGEVIDRLSIAGEVPVTKATAAIDAQIAALQATRLDEFKPVIDRLDGWKGALQGQDLAVIERIRRQMGESFSGAEHGAVRTAGSNALSKIYGPLRDDMGAFIQANGRAADYNKWSVANRRLSEGLADIGRTSLGSVLKRGDETPENVRRLLFSQKTSDVQRLYANLSRQGRVNARAAVMMEAIEKAGGIDGVSPAKFANQVAKMGRQIGVMFNGEDRDMIEGLTRTLHLTQQADRAGLTPPTGLQNFYSTGATAGIGAMGGSPIAAVLSAGGFGLAARTYESPAIRGLLLRMSRAKAGSAAEKSTMRALTAKLANADRLILSQNVVQQRRE